MVEALPGWERQMAILKDAPLSEIWSKLLGWQFSIDPVLGGLGYADCLRQNKWTAQMIRDISTMILLERGCRLKTNTKKGT